MILILFCNADQLIFLPEGSDLLSVGLSYGNAIYGDNSPYLSNKKSEWMKPQFTKTDACMYIVKVNRGQQSLVLHVEVVLKKVLRLKDRLLFYYYYYYFFNYFVSICSNIFWYSILKRFVLYRFRLLNYSPEKYSLEKKVWQRSTSFITSEYRGRGLAHAHLNFTPEVTSRAPQSTSNKGMWIYF